MNERIYCLTPKGLIGAIAGMDKGDQIWKELIEMADRMKPGKGVPALVLSGGGDFVRVEKKVRKKP